VERQLSAASPATPEQVDALSRTINTSSMARLRAALLTSLLTSLLAPVIASTTPAFAWRRDGSSDLDSSSSTETALVSRRRRYRSRAAGLTRAPVTRALLIGNGAAFLVTTQRRGVFDMLAKNDMLLRSGPPQYYRLVTACFLHASIPHILVNSMSLNNLGPAVEQWFGAERFVCTYLVSGVAGNMLSYGVGRSPLSVGASGAIFGLLGAWGVFLKRNEGVFNPGVVQASLSGLVQTCALNAAMGMQARSIDNMGHLGGLLGGAACSFLFGPRLVANPYTGAIVDKPLLQLPGSGRRPRRRQRR
jgi:uridine nucleosidase